MTKLCDGTKIQNGSEENFRTKLIRKIDPSSENYDFIAKLFKEMENQEKNKK